MRKVTAAGANAKNKVRIPVSKIVVGIILVLYTAFIIVPLLTVLITSVTPTQQLNDSMSFVWFPKVTFAPYGDVFTNDIYYEINGIPSFLLGFFNTMWMTLVPLVGGLLVSSLAAYSFSKIKFRGKEKLFVVEIAIMVCPMGAFGIVSYAYYAILGWTATALPLIVPGLFGGVGTVFFIRMFMDGLPDALVESAEIDGAGFFGVFFKIIFPLAKPAVVAQFIFGFVGGYNNYLGPLLYLNGNEQYITLSLVLANVAGIFTGNGMENVHCAAAILGMIPLVIVYLCTQRYFIEGISVGSVKG